MLPNQQTRLDSGHQFNQQDMAGHCGFSQRLIPGISTARVRKRHQT